jgi:DNA-binding response OmpR family regulator
VSIRGLTVDIEARRIDVNGRHVELTPREWALLELFLSRPGRVLSKTHIAESLFSADDHPSPNAIEVHVSRLRAKIDPADVRIRTVRGFGYLLENGDE